jgi:putative membrane protein
VGSQIIIPVVFALAHGWQTYGLRGILVFLATCLAIGNTIENIGVAFAFPFGHYYFTDVMGPKLFHVPISMGFAYVALGYSCWTVANIILNGQLIDRPRANALFVPVSAALLMVAWDVAMDPIWSNVGHFWRWYKSGAYFGVPLLNFFGWFLASYLIFQSFEIYLRHARTTADLTFSHRRIAVLAFTVVTASNALGAASLLRLSTVTDGAGVQWHPRSMAAASVFTSVFVMGGFALLAWLRLRENECSSRRESVQSVAGHGSARGIGNA